MKPRIALFLISWLLAVALVGANLGAQVPAGVSSNDEGGARQSPSQDPVNTTSRRASTDKPTASSYPRR